MDPEDVDTELFLAELIWDCQDKVVSLRSLNARLEEVEALRQLLPQLHPFLDRRNYEDLQVELEAADRDAREQLAWTGG